MMHWMSISKSHIQQQSLTINYPGNGIDQDARQDSSPIRIKWEDEVKMNESDVELEVNFSYRENGHMPHMDLLERIGSYIKDLRICRDIWLSLYPDYGVKFEEEDEDMLENGRFWGQLFDQSTISRN